METSKIIMLVVILGGFITMMYLFRNALNKSCSDGDIYDEQLKRCVINCSLTQPNTTYDSDKDACVTNCIGGQKTCGKENKCYNNSQRCINDHICNLNEDLCGSTCYNPNTHQCIKNTIYSNDKVCDKQTSIACDKDQQCSYSKEKCVTCPDGRQLCGPNDTCCGEGQFCEDDGTCKSCDPKTKTVCGNTCCTNGQKCTPSGKCVTCSTDLCGEECCESGKECASGQCCDPDHIYHDSKGNKLCCANKACGNICCGSDQECQNGKCMIKCGNDSGIFCDPDTTLCMETKNPKTPYYCATIGCEWDQLDYNPPNMPISNNQSQKVCIDNKTSKLYITKQGDKNLSRTVNTQQSIKSKAPCGDEDCKGRLIEDGIQHVIHDGRGCSGDFSCNDMLPESIANCPFFYKDGNPDIKRCCTGKDGNYTGQVCNEGETCIDELCTSCVDTQCNNKGKCSKTISNKCECDAGYDPSNNCQMCLTDVQRDLNNNCRRYASIAGFNCWNVGSESGYAVQNFILAEHDTEFINISNVSENDKLFNFNKTNLKKFTKMIFHISYSDCGSCLPKDLEKHRYALCNGWEDNCRSGVTDLVLDINSVIDSFGDPMSIRMFWSQYVHAGFKARIELYLI